MRSPDRFCSPSCRGRHPLFARLRRSAGADRRAGRLGATLGLRAGLRRQGYEVSARLSSFDAGHRLDPLRFHAGSGRRGRLQRPDVQLVSRRHEVGDRDGGGCQCDRTRSAGRWACLSRPAALMTCRPSCGPLLTGARSRAAGWSRSSPRRARRAGGFKGFALGRLRDFRAPSEYVRRSFADYGIRTDPSGWYGALYRPYHFIGLELAE